MARPKPSRPSATSILALADQDGLVEVRVSAGAGSDAIVIVPSGPGFRLVVRTTAPAEGGKANDAILRLLAKALDRPVSSLELIRGERSRNKLIRILG